ncbi:MAG: TRAP transporter substrate-binding protein [Candidatus Pelagibacter bacterium]|jgi:TRAP-type mannitol/chloroaromatic compound transport system substrate-binding protein|nr:TRAP transporter substrate-binding protein [Candidatus Pelagibacter bacterium]MBL6862669.1 TRAP transporter substrate-binding protein [Candidatus Pelagibacter bacterium]MDA7750620.1 TRAP transporter substrate-binding protein [Candidatus Pelagibacter sp.]MDC0600968.1 TRAP transporter substrate-binding protein [Candidatus Pelagibacter sp.]
MSWKCTSFRRTTRNKREGKNMIDKSKSLMKSFVSILAVFALMITFSFQQVNAAEKIRWKVQSTFNTGWPALGDPVARLADTLDKATDGRIKLKVYEPGKILPPLEISPSISKGDLPAAYNYMAYDQGRIPAAVLFAAVPFGMEPWEYAAWWFEGEGSKLANEIYNKQNIKVLLCSTIGPETAGWYRNPITSLDDLKGLKIRFSGLGGMVLNEIGASATLMAGGEIFAALEKGTLDATEYSMPAIDEVLGFHKITKFNLFPGWHQVSTSTHFMVNLDLWKKMGAADQALFEMACTAAAMRAITTGEFLQGKQIASFPSKGVTAARLPDSVLRELQKVSAKVMAEQSAKDADFKKVWNSQQAFMKEYDVWQKWGYLPRNF